MVEHTSMPSSKPTSKVVQLKPRARFDAQAVDTEAAAWMSRVDRGLSEAERQELGAWLAEDPRHVRAFVELARAWDSLEALGALSGLVELPERAAKPARRSGRVAAIAAATMVFAIAAFSAWRMSAGNTPDAVDAAATAWKVSFATQTGERRIVTLPDGSRVSLNTQTRLEAAFDGGIRRVDMSAGEATFEVAHDPSHPFIVRAASRDIRAVGTVFTVRAKSPDSVSVIVSEGRVMVSPASGPRPTAKSAALGSGPAAKLLAAGERLDAGPSTVQTRQVSSVDIADALAWHGGMIVFQGEPLTEALDEISRYTDVRFEIADPAAGSMRVAGVFRVDDLPGFIAALNVNLGITATARADGSWLLARSPQT